MDCPQSGLPPLSRFYDSATALNNSKRLIACSRSPEWCKLLEDIWEENMSDSLTPRFARKGIVRGLDFAEIVLSVDVVYKKLVNFVFGGDDSLMEAKKKAIDVLTWLHAQPGVNCNPYIGESGLIDWTNAAFSGVSTTTCIITSALRIIRNVTADGLFKNATQFELSSAWQSLRDRGEVPAEALVYMLQILHFQLQREETLDLVDDVVKDLGEINVVAKEDQDLLRDLGTKLLARAVIWSKKNKDLVSHIKSTEDQYSFWTKDRVRLHQELLQSYIEFSKCTSKLEVVDLWTVEPGFTSEAMAQLNKGGSEIHIVRLLSEISLKDPALVFKEMVSFSWDPLQSLLVTGKKENAIAVIKFLDNFYSLSYPEQKTQIPFNDCGIIMINTLCRDLTTKKLRILFRVFWKQFEVRYQFFRSRFLEETLSPSNLNIGLGQMRCIADVLRCMSVSDDNLDTLWKRLLCSLSQLMRTPLSEFGTLGVINAIELMICLSDGDWGLPLRVWVLNEGLILFFQSNDISPGSSNSAALKRLFIKVTSEKDFPASGSVIAGGGKLHRLDDRLLFLNKLLSFLMIAGLNDSSVSEILSGDLQTEKWRNEFEATVRSELVIPEVQIELGALCVLCSMIEEEESQSEFMDFLLLVCKAIRIKKRKKLWSDRTLAMAVSRLVSVTDKLDLSESTTTTQLLLRCIAFFAKNFAVAVSLVFKMDPKAWDKIWNIFCANLENSDLKRKEREALQDLLRRHR